LIREVKVSELNCELRGLFIDSVHSHIAWMRSIKDKFGVEIPFPIINDLSMNVARADRIRRGRQGLPLIPPP
jgi:alkyl hydroperoxide reductase subunit AhpC